MWPRSRAAGTRRSSTDTDLTSGPSTEGHGDVDLGAAKVKLPADNPMFVPGTTLDVDVEPVDLSAWVNVATGLVLGVFEGEQQVGTATVLAR